MNLIELLGDTGALGGITGDNPGGLNAMQRFAMPPEQQAALNVKSNVSALAGNPDFQALSPGDQKLVMAKVAGDPNLLAEGSQQKFMQNLDFSNRPKAVTQLMQFLSPSDALKTMVDPMSQGMIGQPSGGAAQPASPAPAGAVPSIPNAANGNAASNDTRNWQYLKNQVPPFYQNQVIDYAQGGELPKDVAPKDRTLIANWAHNFDPTFTESIGAQRAAMIKNATSGDMYNMSKTVDTSLGHLYDLHQIAPSLGNGNNSIPAANWAENLVQGHLEPGGNPSLERYKSSLKTAAPEIAKYLGGGAATDTGTAEASASYDPTLPDSVIQKNATDLGAKMMTKAGALQDEYNQTMGAFGRHKILSDQSKALYSDMQGLPLTFSQQQLVNQHRAEANLPLKKWGASQTVSQPIDIRPPDQPKNAPVTPAASTVAPYTAQQIQVEMARRAALKSKGN